MEMVMIMPVIMIIVIINILPSFQCYIGSSCLSSSEPASTYAGQGRLGYGGEKART